jgi:hypothetical protein
MDYKDVRPWHDPSEKRSDARCAMVRRPAARNILERRRLTSGDRHDRHLVEERR